MDVTGLVNRELLLRNEYLTAENRILRAHLPARLRSSDAERSTLAEIAKRLGRKALQQIARMAKPDTLLAWSFGENTRRARACQGPHSSLLFGAVPRCSSRSSPFVINSVFYSGR
jgi:hypothetical protein